MGKDQNIKPLFKRIDYIRIPVSNLEEELKFYSKKLDHPLLWHTETSIGLKIPESEAEIVIHIEPDKLETDILVEYAEKAAQCFIEVGGSIVYGPFDIPIGKCVIVKDPWNNQFVLLDNSRGIYQTDEDANVIGIAKKEY